MPIRRNPIKPNDPPDEGKHGICRFHILHHRTKNLNTIVIRRNTSSEISHLKFTPTNWLVCIKCMSICIYAYWKQTISTFISCTKYIGSINVTFPPLILSLCLLCMCVSTAMCTDRHRTLPLQQIISFCLMMCLLWLN